MVRKGQSTLEYILLLTAVLGAVIFFVMDFAGNSNPAFTTKLNGMYVAGADGLGETSSILFSSLNSYGSTSSIFINNSAIP